MSILCAFDRFAQSTDRAALSTYHAALLTDWPITHQSIDRATIGQSGMPATCAVGSSFNLLACYTTYPNFQRRAHKLAKWPLIICLGTGV